jgi:hypothetical protein
MRRCEPTGDGDLDASSALLAAHLMPDGPERTEALNKATRLRHAANTSTTSFPTSSTRPSSGSGRVFY